MSHVAHKIFKPIAKVLNKIPGGSIIGPAVAAYFGGPVGAAAFSAANTLGKGGSIGQALLSGGGSFLGGKFGGNVFGDLGSVGQGLSNTFGNSVGNTIASGVGGLADASVSSALGGFAGNSLADSVSGFNSDQAAMANAPKPIKPFQASQQSELDLPGSLAGFSGLNPDQRSSNLANQGTYGGGLGPDEQQYFLNLINRRLVDPAGKTNDIGSLQPIESSYLQKLGLGGYGNSNDLLQAISQWHGA